MTMHIPPMHQIIDTVTSVVTIASIACNLLPKSTVFNDYPRVKKFYETSINFIIALGLNFRQCMPSLGLHIPGLGFDKPATTSLPTFTASPSLADVKSITIDDNEWIQRDKQAIADQKSALPTNVTKP